MTVFSTNTYSCPDFEKWKWPNEVKLSSGIHPLLWKTRNSRWNPSIVLCRSNRAEVTKQQREAETEDGSVRHQYGAYGEKQRANS